MRVRYLVALSLAFGLSGITAVLVFTAGPVPLQVHDQVASVLPGVFRQRWQQLLALILLAIGTAYLRTHVVSDGDTDPGRSSDSSPPEEPQTPPRIVGEELATTVTETRRKLRQGVIQPSADTEPQQTLQNIVVTAVRLRDGCSRATAAETVETGAWTDDRLAQAFLSDEISYPARHQLLQWGRTDLAYERALEHTIQIVEQTLVRDLPGHRADTVQNPNRRVTRSSTQNGRQSSTPAESPSSEPAAAGDTEANNRQPHVSGNKPMTSKQYQYTGHGRVPVAAALLLAAIGVFLSNSVLVAVAMAPLVFVVASAVTTVPSADEIQLTRAVSPQQTYPGGAATVTLTVTNESAQHLSELHIIDGVPDDLGVVDGSPRAAVQLEAGESVTITYTLRLRHGDHTFQPVTLRTHNLSGTRRLHTEQDATGDKTVASQIGVDESPLPDATARVAGALPTDSGGEGLEFYGIRSYQPSDPITRINWRQYARERTLSTVEYTRREAATVVLMVDVRPTTWVAPTATTPTAAESAVQAAAEAAHSLLAAQHRVGLAILTPTHPDADDGWVWCPPENARTARTRFQTVLDAATAPPDGDDADEQPGHPEVETVRQHIRQSSPDAQIVLFSAVTDDYPIELCTSLRQADYRCHVYAPDVSARHSLSATVETMLQRLRLQTLRARDIPVASWPCDQPLGQSIATTDDRRREASTRHAD